MIKFEMIGCRTSRSSDGGLHCKSLIKQGPV